jgi:hypothetical protein
VGPRAGLDVWAGGGGNLFSPTAIRTPHRPSRNVVAIPATPLRFIFYMEESPKRRVLAMYNILISQWSRFKVECHTPYTVHLVCD